MREGKHTLQDIEFLQALQRPNIDKEVLHLFGTNELVNKHNDFLFQTTANKTYVILAWDCAVKKGKSFSMNHDRFLRCSESLEYSEACIFSQNI